MARRSGSCGRRAGADGPGPRPGLQRPAVGRRGRQLAGSATGAPSTSGATGARPSPSRRPTAGTGAGPTPRGRRPGRARHRARLGRGRVLAGQSWGAGVVLEAACRHPGAGAGRWSASTAPPATCRTGCRTGRSAPGCWPRRGSAGTPWDLLAGRLPAPTRTGRRAGWPARSPASSVRADGTAAPWLTFDRHLEVLRGLWEHRVTACWPRMTVPGDLPARVPRTATRPGRRPSGPAWRRRWRHCPLACVGSSWMAGDHDLHAQHPAAVAAVLRGRRRHEGRPAPPGCSSIMGSGETRPPWSPSHQKIFARLGRRRPGPALLLDTPFGFQANADDLGDRAVRYFDASVGERVDVVRLPVARPAAAADPVADEQALDELRAADWVFAGPGSPTYALRRWARHAGPRPAGRPAARGRLPSPSPPPPRSPWAWPRSPSTRSTRCGEEPAWLRGARPARRGHRAARRARPALRQRRGRQPRHPVLLPRRAPAGRAWSASCPTAPSCWASTSTPGWSRPRRRVRDRRSAAAASRCASTAGPACCRPASVVDVESLDPATGGSSAPAAAATSRRRRARPPPTRPSRHAPGTCGRPARQAVADRQAAFDAAVAASAVPRRGRRRARARGGHRRLVGRHPAVRGDGPGPRRPPRHAHPPGPGGRRRPGRQAPGRGPVRRGPPRRSVRRPAPRSAGPSADLVRDHLDKAGIQVARQRRPAWSGTSPAEVPHR